MSKILITGITGFVGPYLYKELQKKGHKIFGLSREGRGDLKNDLVLLTGDLLDNKSVYKFLSEIKPDVIFHLAAQSKPGLSFKQPDETFESNVLGTLHVFESVRGLMNNIENYRPRILVAGTSEEYGLVSERQLPLVEDSAFNPVNPYAISKLSCYYLAKMYIKSYGLDIVYMVPFSHIGPGQREGFIVPDVCKQIAEIEEGIKEPVLLTGNLSVFRDYTDVRDMVKAYVLLMEKGKTGERYNLCSGKAIKIEKIVEKLLSLSNKKIEHKIDVTKIRPSEMPILYGSSNKMFELSGWRAEITLEKTLADTLDWWRKKIAA